METNTFASWSNMPKPWKWLSIKNAVTQLSTLYRGILLDGALISDLRRPLVVVNEKKSRDGEIQFSLDLEQVNDARIITYNPGVRRISSLFPDIRHGHDVAQQGEDEHSVMTLLQMEKEWLVRLVSYVEALRYFLIPGSDKLIADVLAQGWDVSRILRKSVYQVTAKWSEKVRIIMKERNAFPPLHSFSGWGLRNRMLLHS